MDESDAPVYYEKNRDKVVGHAKLEGDEVLLEITDPDVIKMLKGDHLNYLSIDGEEMATSHSDAYYSQREKERLVLNVDVPWRTGRRNPKNIYAQHTDKPTTDDPSIGYMDSGELAKRVVSDHNRIIQENK